MIINIVNYCSRLLSRGLLALIILAILSGSVTSISTGQGLSTWSEPVMLGPGWFPDLTTDITGTVHVAWSNAVVERDPNIPSLRPASRRGYDLVLYTFSQDGSEWSDTYDIAAFRQSEGSEVTRPAIIIDSDGVFHMTFRYNRVFYSQSRLEGAVSAKSWAKPYPLSVEQIAYFSRIDKDSQGRLHTVFTENVRTFDCPICYHLFYRYSDTNGQDWTIRTDISTLPIGTAKPQLVIGPEDNIHVVWEAGRGGALGQLSDPTTVMYAASYDRGESWSRPVEFVVPDGRAKNITIGIDGMGKLVVVWLALPENTIYYQVSSNQGRSWSDPVPLEGVRGGWAVYPARLDHYTMAADSAGNLHLVVVGRLQDERGRLDLVHVTWNGRSWSEPDLITSYAGDAPEWPRAVVGNGNQLHVVWFVRDEENIFDSDQGQYTVWYSSRTINAPAVQPGIIPTATPVPVIEPTPTPAPPTPTPVDPSLALDPVSPDQALSIYGELDEMILIGQALIPAVGLLLFMIVLIRRKKG
jgi:hypothetical protein